MKIKLFWLALIPTLMAIALYPLVKSASNDIRIETAKQTLTESGAICSPLSTANALGLEPVSKTELSVKFSKPMQTSVSLLAVAEIRSLVGSIEVAGENDSATVLANLPTMDRCRALNVFATDRIVDFPPLNNFPSIERLAVGKLSTTEGGDVEIAKCKRLQWLSCHVSSVTSGFILATTQLNLERLSICEADHIPDEIKAIFNSPIITHLDLRFSKVDDSLIAGISRCRQLATLRLGSTEITNNSVGELASMGSLRYLDVFDTGIDLERLEFLRLSLPNCRVHGGRPVK